MTCEGKHIFLKCLHLNTYLSGYQSYNFSLFFFSGIDIIPFLEFINLPETFIEPLRNSSLGYIAVASAFYKLATPARYMVTLGVTTVAVKILTKRDIIKPAPTKEQIKTIIQNKLKKDASENKS